MALAAACLPAFSEWHWLPTSPRFMQVLGNASLPSHLSVSAPHTCAQDETLRGIAEKHGRAPAEVLVAWALRRGTSCLPKSTKAEHLR